MTLEIFPASELLRVDATGDFSFTEARDGIGRALEVLVKHSLNKVLVDYRQVTGEPTMMDRYAFSVALAEELRRASGSGLSPRAQFAFVGMEPMIEKRRFGETVGVNRGINMRVMESLHEALQWLGIDPAAPMIATE